MANRKAVGRAIARPRRVTGGRSLNNFTVIRTFDIPPRLDAALRRRAQSTDKSPNEVLQEILQEGLEREARNGHRPGTDPKPDD